MNRLRWIATGMVVSSAVLAALNAFPWNFLLSCVGCVILAATSYKMNDYPMVFLNVVIIVLNFIAAINYWGLL